MLNVPKLNNRSEVSGAAVSTASGTPAPRAPREVRLSHPIKTHAGEARNLTFRDPVGADYINIKRLPFDVRGDNQDRRIVVDFEMAAKWIAALTGHDEIIIGQLHQRDWLDAVAVVNEIIIDSGVDSVGNSSE